MKIAILKVKEESQWHSCRTISKNLMAAYKDLKNLMPNKVHNYEYSRSNPAELHEAIQEMKKNKITRVTIVDHFPYPLNLFQSFSKSFDALKYYPEIYVHVYGCLTLWLNEVNHNDSFFSKCKIHFITASEAQKNLLGQFLSQKNLPSVINFPIDNTIFKYQANYKTTKKELGFSESDILLIYTGRAHIQKNLPLLLQSIAPLMRENRNIKFLFAGSYDDSSINFLDYKFSYGTSYNMIQKELKDGDILSQFIDLGSLDHKNLARYLSISDIFCSMSTYSDEDYGYAPLEALASGCAALLSSWGGYKEFHSPYTSYVQVKRDYIEEDDSLYLSPAEIKLKLQILLGRVPFSRKTIAQHYKEHFSIAASSAKLKAVHESSTAHNLSFSKEPFLKFKERRKFSLDKYYFMEIYESYFKFV